MPWTWIRPDAGTALEQRPLLDVGTGDGETLRALVRPEGLVIGIDRSIRPLRPIRRRWSVNVAVADALWLPIRDGTIRTVVAGDLAHHLDDDALRMMLEECVRVLRPGGTLVAWWWRHARRPAPDAPRYPRPVEEVARIASRCFSAVDRLELRPTVEPAPATVGIKAVR